MPKIQWGRLVLPVNKQLRRSVTIMLALVVAALLGGCGSVGAMAAREQMERRNEADLKNGKSTPREYRERRDEIDRNLK